MGALQVVIFNFRRLAPRGLDRHLKRSKSFEEIEFRDVGNGEGRHKWSLEVFWGEKALLTLTFSLSMRLF